VSLVAERAVRFLRERREPANSVSLARELLATRAPDEATATRILQSAFAGDPRLGYREGSWRLAEPRTGAGVPRRRRADPGPDPDRVLLFVLGERVERGQPFQLRGVSAIRLQGDDVVSACGGEASDGVYGSRLRRSILQTLEGAVPVIHDAPGAISALETWLGEALPAPVSLRRLARERLGLAGRHDFEMLVARLGLPWRASEDPLEQADTLDACLERLRRPGESLQDLRVDQVPGVPGIDWSRFAFGHDFLRRIPHTPGTYRFFDAAGNLLYVGKSKDLGTRIGSYFREGTARSQRVQRLLDSLYRIEYDSAGSDLEAMLREAAEIRAREPAANRQRKIHPRRGSRAGRLLSVLILEPAEPPATLRAYLIRDARLIERVAIGPRGGGLARVARVLDDWFFSVPVGPTAPTGPDLDVEVVARWLATNRDRVVAFDPTDLQSTEEVIERLRWFLHQGGPFDTDGSPVFRR